MTGLQDPVSTRRFVLDTVNRLLCERCPAGNEEYNQVIRCMKNRPATVPDPTP
jgi:hypothetical protein